MADMIRATGLVKKYKEVVALAGLDLTVPEGKVLAVLGPNGAGKTTAVRILATLLTADEGTAEVAGIDVAKNPNGVRARIGLSGQYAAVDEYLTGFENLQMVGRLYGIPKAAASKRARELLERFDLDDAGDRPAKTYSGGMRRRLDLAGALVAAPPVLILDEPTTGLDVRSRQQMWTVIRDLVASGSTLLLTTQYLEEADVLADDIVVIDHGRAIARGTADELKAQTGGERIELVLTDRAQREVAAALLAAVAIGEVQIVDNGRALTAAVDGGVPQLRSVLAELESRHIDVLDVGLRRPTLDDVFLSLTGRAAEAAVEPANQAEEVPA
ncbi:ATP-binding cassette domain-containing protein [Aeromicrobium wangtongii]|uniref:ATP-binding cassette domain-containing protein n=1 Tax=Aeromicrobium wangtongii TaxID=2969247 RepID=UPI002016E1F5|nr:ATP-binding cassette domain-containing protein [Aeromicrobium wangtongii]MCL3818480.1 ATP-binding cassette domain-containing protein [Aeromicrobium wangtongii]